MFLAAFTSALQANLQVTHAKRAWLLRLSDAMRPHALQRWLVNAGLTLSTRQGALSSKRRASRPQPEAMISLLSPALALTFRPGSALVPRAERAMLAIFR